MTATAVPPTAPTRPGSTSERALAASRRSMVRRGRLRVGLEITTPIVVIAVIWMWSSNSGIYFFPPLSDVLTTFGNTWFSERLLSDVLPSLRRMSIGYLTAAVIGLLAGICLGQSPRLSAALAPVLEFIRAIPAVAVIPLAIFLLGVDDTAKVILIAFICVWPVLLNTIDGVRGMDSNLLETARVYGISWWRRQTRVILPATMPQVFAGLRTSLAFALIMLVTSEMLASTNGIGFFVLQAQRTFAMQEMWAGILLIGIFGYVLNLLFVVVERYAIDWHRGANQAAE